MRIFSIVIAALFFAMGVQAQIVSHPKARDVVKRASRPRLVQAVPQLNNEKFLERSARDLIYMPRAGDYLLDSSLNYTVQASTYQINNIHIADRNQTGYKLKMSIVGGITEFLAFSLGIAQGESSAEIKNTNGTLTTLKNTGFESPELGATFLIYEQSPYKPVDVILKLAYTPRFGSPQAATATKEGNNIATSDKIAASVDIVRKSEQYQLNAHLGFQPTSSGVSEDATNGDEIDVNTASLIELEGRGQWLLIEQLFLTGGVSYLMYGASESSNQTTKNSSDPFNVFGFRVGVKLMLNSNHTYLTGDVGYAMLPDYDSMSSGTRIKVMNASATVLLFGIAHTF